MSSAEFIFRAAQAVEIATGTHCSTCEQQFSWDAEEVVRVVLRAIRAPTEAMKLAGVYDDFGEPGNSKYISDDDAEGVWQRMIDAALRPDTQGDGLLRPDDVRKQLRLKRPRA